jgi:XTP/dITP diphosphohydrolase
VRGGDDAKQQSASQEEHAQSHVIRVYLASSNPGKLREYGELAGPRIRIEPLPDFDSFPASDESAPTFAENAAGKALHYSRFTQEIVLADDSGLVVPALGGAPGVQSARYAGAAASDADRYKKLLREMETKTGDERKARFVCVIAIAQKGKALAIVSDRAEGALTCTPRGSSGFGYDPIFLFPELGLTFAELAGPRKNQYSHRGKAFRKAQKILEAIVS